jgi:hypothetical protein
MKFDSDQSLVVDSFEAGLRGDERPPIQDPFDDKFLGKSATKSQLAAWPVATEYGAKVAMLGGKGSGKTMLFGGLHCYTVQRYPGCKLFLSAATYLQASESTAEKMIIVADMLGLKMKYREKMIIDRQKHSHVYHFTDFDSFVCVRSADNMDNIEGSEWDGGSADEIQLWTERKIKVAFARIRRNKRSIFRGVAGLPEDEQHWQYKFLKDAEFDLWEIDTHENEHNLVDGYIDELRSMYQGPEAERYISGKRASLTAMPVFTNYNDEIHRKGKSKVICSYDPYLRIYIVFDFNVAPTCVSVWQIKKLKQRNLEGYEVDTRVLVQIDEFEEWRFGTEGACEQILERYADHKHGITVVGDASGNSRDTRNASQTDYTIIASKLGSQMTDFALRRGLIVNRKVGKKSKKKTTYDNPPVKDSIQLCNRLLIRPDGTIGVFFLPESRLESKGCGASVRNYKWDETGRVSKDVDKLSGRHISRTHFSDTFRYAVWLVTGGSYNSALLASSTGSNLINSILRVHTHKQKGVAF